MRALIVTNAYINNKSQISQAERISEELKALGVQTDLKRNADLASIVNGNIKVVKNYDFCVFLDKDRVAARLLEKSGLRLYNSAEAIEVCDDKMLTSVALSGNGINLPDCVYAPLCYNPQAEPDKEFLKGVERRLGYPLIAKINYGSLGMNVSLIKNFAELEGYERKFMLSPHFYQQYIGSGRGEDIRVIVVGGKYVCAMKRINDSDFRSNIELGGKGENFNAEGALISLCERVAAILKLDYCGIDVLIGDGGYYICEVNSNAFFAAAEKVCGVNVAKAYAEHMVKAIR